MKNIKMLVPVVVLLVTVLGFYTMIDTNTQKMKQYNETLQIARDYASQGIVDDAVKYFEKALTMDTDVDTYIEYVNVYVDNGYEKKALRVAEEMVNKLKDSEKAYECLLDRYIQLESYEDCFKLNDEAESRNMRTDEFINKMAEIEYKYADDYQLFSTVKTYSNGYVSVESGDLYGILDETGGNVLRRTYKNAGHFSYYTSKNKDDSGFVVPIHTKDDKWMYISDKGNKKIDIPEDINFDYLGLFVDKGLTSASVNGKYAYYNSSFEKQFGDYSYASTFNCARAFIMEGENEWYLINESGEKLNSIAYTAVVFDEKEIAFRNDRAFVAIDGSYRMIDVDGNVIGDGKYVNASPFFETDANGKESKQSLAAVNIDGKWGFVNKNGEVVIEAKFESAHSFANSFAAVGKDGKWGFINTDGEIIIDCIFEDVKDFNTKGCVFVMQNSRWHLIKLYKYNH